MKKKVLKRMIFIGDLGCLEELGGFGGFGGFWNVNLYDK